MNKKNPTHRERLEDCLAGEVNDRPPVALWRHFPVDDQNPGTLAQAVLNFQRTYDFDFVKVTPASSYCLRDWGISDEWRGSTEGTREYTRRVIRTPEDWARLPVLDPKKGALAESLEALRLITKELGKDTPIIQTIFSPLSQAKNLAGQDLLLAHIRRYPEAVKAGLQTITRSIQIYLTEAMQIGIDGVFYAVQHAQYGLLSEEEYLEFGKPFDLPALELSDSGWFNVLHLHGSEVMFDLLADYPVQVINWHDLETTPTLSAGLERFSGAVCGGLRQWDTLVLGTANDVRREAYAALAATRGQRFILGTGCVAPITAPHGNILAARRAFDETETESD